MTRVRLRITPQDRDIGAAEIVLAASAGGIFGGSGFELPFAGRYRLQVQVRRSDTVDDLAYDFDLAVASATASPSPSPSASSSPSATPTAPPASGAGTNALALVGLIAALAVVAALVFLLWRRA